MNTIIYDYEIMTAFNYKLFKIIVKEYSSDYQIIKNIIKEYSSDYYILKYIIEHVEDKHGEIINYILLVNTDYNNYITESIYKLISSKLCPEMIDKIKSVTIGVKF